MERYSVMMAKGNKDDDYDDAAAGLVLSPVLVDT